MTESGLTHPAAPRQRGAVTGRGRVTGASSGTTGSPRARRHDGCRDWLTRRHADRRARPERRPPSGRRPAGRPAARARLIWLAATMWGAHASIVGNAADAAVALGAAASSLPVVVAASLLAGAAAGLAVAGRFAAGPRRPLRRLAGRAARRPGVRDRRRRRDPLRLRGQHVGRRARRDRRRGRACSVAPPRPCPPPVLGGRARRDPGRVPGQRRDQLLPGAADRPVRRGRHPRLAGPGGHAVRVCPGARRRPRRRARRLPEPAAPAARRGLAVVPAGRGWSGPDPAARRRAHAGRRRLAGRPGQRPLPRRPGGHGVQRQRPAAQRAGGRLRRRDRGDDRRRAAPCGDRTTAPSPNREPEIASGSA